MNSATRARSPAGPDRAAPIDPAAVPRPETTDDCVTTIRQVFQDGLPEVEVFDIDGATWKRLPHLEPGNALRRRRPCPLRRPDVGGRPHPLRQRPATRRGFQVDVAITGTFDDRHRAHPRPHQALRPDGRGRRHRSRHRGGRDLRAGRAERRRQDDDAPDARHAPAADPPVRPRSPAGPSPGTPTRSVASSGSCRMRSGSTTT